MKAETFFSYLPPPLTTFFLLFVSIDQNRTSHDNLQDNEKQKT